MIILLNFISRLNNSHHGSPFFIDDQGTDMLSCSESHDLLPCERLCRHWWDAEPDSAVEMSIREPEWILIFTSFILEKFHPTDFNLYFPSFKTQYLGKWHHTEFSKWTRKELGLAIIHFLKQEKNGKGCNMWDSCPWQRSVGRTSETSKCMTTRFHGMSRGPHSHYSHCRAGTPREAWNNSLNWLCGDDNTWRSLSSEQT